MYFFLKLDLLKRAKILNIRLGLLILIIVVLFLISLDFQMDFILCFSVFSMLLKYIYIIIPTIRRTAIFKEKWTNQISLVLNGEVENIIGLRVKQTWLLNPCSVPYNLCGFSLFFTSLSLGLCLSMVFLPTFQDCVKIKWDIGVNHLLGLFPPFPFYSFHQLKVKLAGGEGSSGWGWGRGNVILKFLKVFGKWCITKS